MTQTTERPAERQTTDTSRHSGPAAVSSALAAVVVAFLHGVMVGFQIGADDESKYLTGVGAALAGTAFVAGIAVVIAALVAAVGRSRRVARAVSIGALAVLALAEAIVLLRLTVLMPDF